MNPLAILWTPPSQVPEIVLPPDPVPEIVLPGGFVSNDVVTIDFLTTKPVTKEQFRVIGFTWEPGDEEITYIDELLP